MDDICMVVCGDWRCFDGRWKFDVDRIRLSRMVDLNEAPGLRELEDVVLREFGYNVDRRMGIALSYLPKSAGGTYFGNNTPPVVMGSDTALKYYKKMRALDNEFGLYVKLEVEHPTFGTSGIVSDDGLRYLTPRPGMKRRLGVESEAGSSKSGLKRDDYVLGSASIHNSVDYIDDEDLADLAEQLDKTEEQRQIGKNCNLTNEFLDGFIEVETDSADTEEVVSPRHYNHGFWENFVDEVDGRSNAVEIMCTTNDAFGHRVRLGGGSVSYKKDESDVTRNGFIADEPSYRGLYDGEQWMQFGEPNRVRETRGLDEIDDEEFDIPPLYDDSTYVRYDEVPDLDLDYDGDDQRITKGKLFASKQDCQIALAIYAIKHQFRFKQNRTDRRYFVLNCADPKCDWRIMAHECKSSVQYKIIKASLEHTCSIETRNAYCKNATSRVIASVFKAKYYDPVNGPLSMDLQQLVLEDLQVSVLYMKCWRAREKAIVSVRGTDDDSYKKLSEYLCMLKEANPETITDLVTETEEDGSERFLYMFLAFGASIQGFRHLRRVIVLDGTHLGGRFKGVLLTASGQDANFQVFPLAYAIVDSENTESWTWFFQKLERIVADSKSLMLLSDRHQEIYNAKARIYPLAHHGACLVHLQRNVVAKFKNKGLAKLVGQAARAYRLGRFRYLVGMHFCS